MTVRDKDRITLLAQVLSLAASGWFVWIHSVAPRLGRQTLAAVIAQALFYVVLVWALTAVITFYIRFIARLEVPKDVVAASLRSSAAAMWFAPAVILLSSKTPAGTVVGLVLMVNTTRLLVARWTPLEQPGRQASRRGQGTWRFVVVMSGSLILQAGAVAALWGKSFLAAGLFAASIAILTSLYVLGARGEDKPSRVPPSPLSIALTLLLAATITTGGLQMGMKGGAGDEQDGGPANGPKDNVTDLFIPRTGLPGDFPGVILRPEVKKPKTLEAPVAVTKGKSGSDLAKPLIIPFSGEYWIFRPPWNHPPYGSVVKKGSPVDFSFHTSDGKAMEMEARQKLNPAIDLSCCSSVQVVLTNGGTAGMLSLEITLIKREPGRSWFESLGRRFTGFGSIDASETLSFPVPAAGRGHQIDEILVAFHREQPGMDKSPMVAIQRFVLSP